MSDRRRHAARQLPSWLIFDVRQKMKIMTPRRQWSLFGVLFALIGVSQMGSTAASGPHGFPVSRDTEPALFWLYIATYFVVAGWCLLTAYRTPPSDDKKA